MDDHIRGDLEASDAPPISEEITEPSPDFSTHAALPVPQHLERDELLKRANRAEARAFMAEMGVPKASAPYVLALMGSAPLDSEDLVRECVNRVLRDVPALMGASTPGANPPPEEQDEFLSGFREGNHY